MEEIPFVVGQHYTRQDIYEVLEVPESQRRGNWETGYNRWGNDLYIFATVGSVATGGFDYKNRWEDELFVWYAKEPTKLDQPLIQWMLGSASRVYVFTRPTVREPFQFEGLGTAVSWEDTSPVLIRWQIDRLVESHAEFAILPDEVATPSKYIEGATRRVSVDAYERNPKARQACLNHFGYRCSVCDFDFVKAYGAIGHHYIHVHHLRDLAMVGREYEVDPINDLRPACPNCHAMLHTQKPAMSIDALKAIVETRRLDDPL